MIQGISFWSSPSSLARNEGTSRVLGVTVGASGPDDCEEEDGPFGGGYGRKEPDGR